MRDRDLVRLYWPVDLRPAFDALFAIDDAMADVVTKATEPALAAIKLAWWRERLQELDQGKVTAEPRLQAASEQLLPRGITAAALAGLEDGWALLLQSSADQDAFMRGVAGRGPALFALAAQLLGIAMDDHLDNAAHAFAAADLARRGLVDLVPLELRRAAYRAPKAARPLTAFAALAYRDMRGGGPPFESEATPVRAWTLFRHRLTGRL